ncbi:MAG: histidine phosphatase family protein [Bacillota bacterium]
MRKLILIRHAETEPDPTVDAHLWELTDGGRVRSERLAEALIAYQPVALYASPEKKAQQTATIIGERLGLEVVTAKGLEEHNREGEVGLSKNEFRQKLIEFFLRPTEIVFGNESAVQAHDRFSLTIERIIHHQHQGNLAVVAHGTVLTLFAAHWSGADPLEFWNQLGMPAFFVMDLPGWRLTEGITNIE